MATIYCYGYNEPTLDLLGVVDDFISFNFTRSYSGIGEWQLVIDGSSLNAQRVKGMNFISLGVNVAGYVKHYEDTIENGEHTITFTGVELKGIAAKRLIIPEEGTAYQSYTNQSPEYVIGMLINKQLTNPTDSNRRIYGTIPAYTAIHNSISYSGRY